MNVSSFPGFVSGDPFGTEYATQGKEEEKEQAVKELEQQIDEVVDPATRILNKSLSNLKEILQEYHENSQKIIKDE
jgi:hypothetical protein